MTDPAAGLHRADLRRVVLAALRRWAGGSARRRVSCLLALARLAGASSLPQRLAGARRAGLVPEARACDPASVASDTQEALEIIQDAAADYRTS